MLLADLAIRSSIVLAPRARPARAAAAPLSGASSPRAGHGPVRLRQRRAAHAHPAGVEHAAGRPPTATVTGDRDGPRITRGPDRDADPSLPCAMGCARMVGGPCRRCRHARPRHPAPEADRGACPPRRRQQMDRAGPSHLEGLRPEAVCRPSSDERARSVLATWGLRPSRVLLPIACPRTGPTTVPTPCSATSWRTSSVHDWIVQICAEDRPHRVLVQPADVDRMRTPAIRQRAGLRRRRSCVKECAADSYAGHLLELARICRPAASHVGIRDAHGAAVDPRKENCRHVESRCLA